MLNSPVRIGLSGQYPGKVCLIRVMVGGEPEVLGAMDLDEARRMADGIALLCRALGTTNQAG